MLLSRAAASVLALTFACAAARLTPTEALSEASWTGTVALLSRAAAEALALTVACTARLTPIKTLSEAFALLSRAAAELLARRTQRCEAACGILEQLFCRCVL